MEPARAEDLPELDHPGSLHYLCYDAAKFDDLREDGATATFRGAVVISYGFTENARKYSELIWYFLLDGYSVCVLEHRGHGYSVRDVDDPERGVDRRLAAVRGRPGQVRRNRWTAVRGGPPDGAVRAFDGRRHRGGRVGTASDAVRQGGALLPDDRPGDRRHPQCGGGGRSRGRLPHGIREEPRSARLSWDPIEEPARRVCAGTTSSVARRRNTGRTPPVTSGVREEALRLSRSILDPQACARIGDADPAVPGRARRNGCATSRRTCSCVVCVTAAGRCGSSASPIRCTRSSRCPIRC